MNSYFLKIIFICFENNNFNDFENRNSEKIFKNENIIVLQIDSKQDDENNYNYNEEIIENIKSIEENNIGEKSYKAERR